MSSNHTPQQILKLTLEPNDADASTVGQYLFALTAAVWAEGEGFDGKRPFGNSDWQDNIIHALILNKVIEGELDEYGNIEDYADSQARKVMDEVFTFLNKADYSSFSLPPEPRDWYLLEIDSYGSLVDTEEHGYTKAGAEEMLETYNSGYSRKRWKAVHIPT